MRFMSRDQHRRRFNRSWNAQYSGHREAFAEELGIENSSGWSEILAEAGRQVESGQLSRERAATIRETYEETL